MKKQLLVLTLLAATSLSSFAQGYFLFGATKNKGFDLSTGAVQPGGTGDTFAFLWANSASAASVVGAGTSASVAGVPSGTWTQIMTDPLFHFATDAGTSNVVAVVGNGASGWSYNGGLSFPVLGSPNSGTLSVFVVGWNNKGGTVNTPAQAAAANSTLGYSTVFTYDPGATSGSQVLTFAAVTGFGIQTVPEPATFAMAGLGAAAMLIFRRRK
jgi:hypothetical protein